LRGRAGQVDRRTPSLRREGHGQPAGRRSLGRRQNQDRLVDARVVAAQLHFAEHLTTPAESQLHCRALLPLLPIGRGRSWIDWPWFHKKARLRARRNGANKEAWGRSTRSG